MDEFDPVISDLNRYLSEEEPVDYYKLPMYPDEDDSLRRSYWNFDVVVHDNITYACDFNFTDTAQNASNPQINFYRQIAELMREEDK